MSEERSRVGDILALVFGGLLMTLGVVLNEWTVGLWMLPGTGLTELPDEITWKIRIGQAVLLICGATVVVFRASPRTRKLCFAGLVVAVLAPGIAELALRASLRIEGSPTRHPRKYASWFSDDDYWRLHGRWIMTWIPKPERIHPLFGWTQTTITDDNPLGLEAATLDRLSDDARKKILFYGDSFVKGNVPTPDHIPNLVEQQLESTDVLDLGVGGYGTDQIYLMFRETHHRLSDPLVIVGIMTYDLDRVVLSQRTARKPRFVVSDGGALELTGVPVSEVQPAAPLDLSSYALSYLTLEIRGRSATSLDRRVAEKKAVNIALLDRFQAAAESKGLDLVFVIFYPVAGLESVDWRERFLKSELDRRGLPYIDTKPVLLAHGESRAWRGLYDDEGGHHNAAGNQSIADAIAAYLRGKGSATDFPEESR